MHLEGESIIWSPRVPQHKIRLLYEKDAQGIIDEELINEVAFSFFTRCSDILTVTAASVGRVKCPKCGSIIKHKWDKKKLMKCNNCSWAMTWGVYFKSYQRKQLHGGGAFKAFEIFVNELPKARNAREKMLLIDRLIHEAHQWDNPNLEEEVFTRPAAVNIISGKLKQVRKFLNDLSIGPEREENHAKWLERELTWERYTENKKRELMLSNKSKVEK
jgi:ribosomal protein L37AE/L43A